MTKSETPDPNGIKGGSNGVGGASGGGGGIGAGRGDVGGGERGRAARPPDQPSPDGAGVPARSGAGDAPEAARDASAAAEQVRPATGAANGVSNGVSTAAPPWQRVAAPEDESEQTVLLLQVGAPEHARAATASKADKADKEKPTEEEKPAEKEPPEKRQPAGQEPGGREPGGQQPGGSPSSGKGPITGQTGYGHIVSQPLSSQSGQGRGQDFSAPTVRFGGRVQSEQGAAQPSMSTRVRPTRIPRRASLQLRHLEPWSVLKVSLVLSVAGFLAWMVAVGVLYGILGGMGVWDQLNGTYSDLTSTSVNDAQSGGELISAGGVFGVAALVGLVNIVLITAMCTVGAFIYNASADLAGGIEVTLSERD